MNTTTSPDTDPPVFRPDQIMRLLSVVATHDATDAIWWRADLRFFVNCNDFFWWGCSDCEPVETEEDVELLDECLKNDNSWGWALYCAKRRGMRPQGAFYDCIPKELWSNFDSCGPEREVGFANPKAHPIP